MLPPTSLFLTTLDGVPYEPDNVVQLSWKTSMRIWTVPTPGFTPTTVTLQYTSAPIYPLYEADDVTEVASFTDAPIAP